MSTHKHIDKICVLVTILTLLFTILFMNGEALGISVIASEDSGNEMFTANDLNGDWDTDGAAKILLSDDGSTVKGNGAYAYNGDLYIAYAGKYIVSGELSNGSIIISADGDDKIWLMLDGVSIHCDDGAAIRVEQADKVFVTLAGETENTVSSGSQYKEDLASSGVDGAIYSRDDLTINGSGMLQVKAEYQHGIVCNDDLVITDGTIEVEAVQDGIHANDSVRIQKADISISAGDDGITVSNDDETSNLYVESGKINISSCYEGLEAVDITIAGGTIDIAPTDDGINANGSGGNSVLRITGGDITIINTNGRDADGLDSNKDIYISGGNILISISGNGSNSAIDYGTENGGVCEINGGTILACGSSAMAEGFASSSPQGFLMYNTSATAGTIVTLENKDGKELLSEEVPCSFSSVVVSTPEMAVGDTCTITVGETSEVVTIDNSASNSGFGGGMRGGMQGGMRGGMQGTSGQNGMQSGAQGNDVQGSDTQGNGVQGGMQGNMPEGMQGGRGQGGMFGGMRGDGNMPSNGQGTDTLPQPPDDAGTEEGSQIFGMPGKTDQGGMRSDFSQDDRNFGGSLDGNKMQEASNIDMESVVLLGISILVLIGGCAVAFFYKRF